MVFQHEAGFLHACLTLIEDRRRKTTDSPAHNYAFVGLAGVLDCGGRSVEDTIANRVTIGHYLVRIAIRIHLITDPVSAIPVFSGHKLKRAGGGNQSSS